MKYLRDNWKTSLAGALVLVIVGLLLGGVVTNEQALTAFGILVAAGLVASKDAGGPTIPPTIVNA
jgi:hypothetical protein